MILENKLNIKNQIELSKVEEKISKQVIDWNLVDKDEYLSAMERSVIKDIEKEGENRGKEME